MTSQALRHHPATGDLPRWLIVGFIPGAVSVSLRRRAAEGAWGLGTGIGLALFGRARERGASTGNEPDTEAARALRALFAA